LPDIETLLKPRIVQKEISKNWQVMIENMKEDESFILPYDIYGGYIGFLYIH
jgi:hypothetical protein